MFNDYKFIFPLIGLIVCFCINYTVTHQKPDNKVWYQSQGIITRIHTDDNAKRWFYVDVLTPDGYVSSQTYRFRTTPKDIKIGDTVNVKYYYSEIGEVRSVIINDGFVPVIRDDVGPTKFFLYMGIIFTVVFVILFIKAFF